jgi:hypothetical protein
MKTEQRRDSRKKETAECFTPSWLVKQMLSKLNEYSKKSHEDSTATFLDPACGNGNILLEVLLMKLANGHDPSQALSTIYGCDIMKDNIRECRLRLLKAIQDTGTKITIDHVKDMFNHIVLTSLSKYPNGSLDYDYTFENKASMKDMLPWINGIENEGWLDDPHSSGRSQDQADEEMKDATRDDDMLAEFAQD